MGALYGVAKNKNSTASGRLKPTTDHFTDGLESKPAATECGAIKRDVGQAPAPIRRAHMSSMLKQVDRPLCNRAFKGGPCPST